MIRAAVDVVRPAAVAREIEIVEEVPADLGACDADPDRLQQIVWNLVSNAVKFTGDRGRITVRASHDDANVRIAVTDTGVGIAREHLQVIFDRFRQVDSSATRQHGGLGLGLALVRYLVAAHGGTVEAESDGIGCGATFAVTLPVRMHAQPASATASEVRTRALAGHRILVVDDDPDGRWLVSEALSDAGAYVQSAGSVSEALALFTAQPYDVVISDIGMPGEDGFSLARQIRATGEPTTLIALTAYTRPEDIRASRDASFQLHLGKPIDPESLIAAIAAAVRRQR